MFSLKKKADQFENEIIEETSKSIRNLAIHCGDRFIPRRFSLRNSDSNLKFATKKQKKDVITKCSSKDYWRENNYLPTLNLVMGMRLDRILTFMDPAVIPTDRIVRTSYQDIKKRKWISYDWPCRPRPKPCASLDSIFDLPEHDSSCDPNLVDWSTKGHIAISFGNDIVIWQSKEDVTMAFDIKCPRSLAYSPNGDFLAIGCKSCDYPVLELWDVSRSQDFCVICGKVFGLEHVAVQCVQWAPSGKQIVCGTRYGCMYVLSAPDMKTIKKIRVHALPVTLIRFSPNMRYLACGDSEGNIVIYSWSMCNLYLFVKSRRKRNAVFDWHPWTGVDLAISENLPGSIVILHVPSKNIVAYYQQQSHRIEINYISFSKLTGELLVSTSKRDGRVCSDYKVLVMSSLDRVVDILGVPDGGARFLMWNPDGSKVATINNDEDMTLWNFYSLKKAKCFKKLNLSKDKSSTDDMSKFGNQFRKWCFLK